jgi:probable HAF family extracellular repeat protein
VRDVRLLGVLAWLLTSAAPMVTADDRVFFMALPPEVLPTAIGSNAFAVAGGYYSGGGLYWMPTSGDRAIGVREALAISRDGTTIVGTALDTRGLANAAIWQDGQPWRLLGGITPSARPCDELLTTSYGTTANAAVVVGLAWDGCSYARAFRWEQSTGMVDLGSLSGRSTRANGISGDGTVIVGWEQDATGPRLGAKWVNLKEELIAGPNGPVGEAYAANSNGSIIVGGVCSYTFPMNAAAWMWKAGSSVQCFPVEHPRPLLTRDYRAIMTDLSDDGRVIGGSFTFGLDAESVIWLDNQPYFLEDYLASHGLPDAFQGWVNTGFITGVSPDGRTLVGYGAGPTTFQGYLVILPEGAK